jgi:hypothetical protein
MDSLEKRHLLGWLPRLLSSPHSFEIILNTTGLAMHQAVSISEIEIDMYDGHGRCLTYGCPLNRSEPARGDRASQSQDPNQQLSGNQRYMSTVNVSTPVNCILNGDLQNPMGLAFQTTIYPTFNNHSLAAEAREVTTEPGDSLRQHVCGSYRTPDQAAGQ